MLPSSLWQYCTVCALLTSAHVSNISIDSYGSLRSCGLYSATCSLHFSFVSCFTWKQLKGISSAVTKGEKTEMFYIGRKNIHYFVLLYRTIIVTLILLKFCILAKLFVSFLKFTWYMYACLCKSNI